MLYYGNVILKFFLKKFEFDNLKRIEVRLDCITLSKFLNLEQPEISSDIASTKNDTQYIKDKLARVRDVE